MDALDANILRELGIEPFAVWPPRVKGLRIADVARQLGVGHQLVKDRIARMTEAGVIVGYGMFPNLRQVGLDLSVVHVPGSWVPSAENLALLNEVDGFCGVTWFLDSDLCVNLVHSTEAERDRRMRLMARLTQADREARILYTSAFPQVARPMSRLDWRIVAAMAQNAKRPTTEVAGEVGVTAKTVRNRLAAMRDAGAIDEFVLLDLARLQGVIPFQIAVWCDEAAKPLLRQRFEDRRLAWFQPPKGGHCDYILRIFAFTPADVQALVADAMAVPGVDRAEAVVATGGMVNDGWLTDFLATMVEIPGSMPSS